MYQALLFDHYRYPRNRGELVAPDFSSGQYHPSCGDSIVFQGMINNGHIETIAFTGNGCVISQATASLLSEYVRNKSLVSILLLNTDFMVTLIDMPLGPLRLKCALLSLEALQQGIMRYQEKEKE